MTFRYFPENHSKEWGVVTARVLRKDRSSEPMTNECVLSVSEQFPVSQAVIPSDGPLPVYFPPGIAQAAFRAIPFRFSIRQPINFPERADPSSSIQPFPSVSPRLYNRSI